jgi:prophage tail gpP-like protein
MIEIFTSGTKIEGFIEANVTRDLDSFCGQFKVTLSKFKDKNLPIKRHSPIVIKASGTTILTGFIEKINISYGEDFHEIIIQGRDKTCDILDTTVDGSFEFNPPTSLTSIIEQLLSYHGISGISVINQAGALKNFEIGDQISGELGSSLFSIIETYCRLRQVLPVTNEDGNLVLIRTTSPASSGSTLAHKINNQSNNILSAEVSYNETKRFNKYIGHSQGNSSALAEQDQEASDISSRKSEAFDSEVRSSRQFNFQAERAASEIDLLDRVKWEANIRRSRASSYKPKVQGFIKQSGAPWKLHETVRVFDEFADIYADLLVCGLEFSYSLSGSITRLTLCVKDAYSLQAEQNAREARANKQGEKL